MSLRVWLPLNGNLCNQGCTPFTISSIEATPTFTAGKIGQCYQRTNSNSQLTNGLRIEDNLIDLFGSTASIAVWVKPLNTHTHYNGTILSSGDWNKKKWAFGVSQDNTKVDVLCGSYNTYINCTVPVNEWTHLVSIYDNGTCTLYKNGTYIGQLTGQKAFETDATWTGICRETYASGYFGFCGCINDLRIYDHCLSAAEVREISQGLILHYKLNSIDIQSGTNLVTGVTAGGRTTVLTDGRVGVQTAGVNQDTYFTINLSENVVAGTSYLFTCDASGISDGQYWGFPLGAQANGGVLPFKIYNGHNVYPFTANGTKSDGTAMDWGTKRLFMDDNYRGDWANQACFYNFQLVKIGASNTIIKVEDSSGYNHNGVCVNTTINNDSPRYDTCVSCTGTTVDSTSNTITGAQFFYCNMDMPAMNAITIAWWGKNIAYGRGGIFETSNTIQTNTTKGTDYNTTAIANWDSTFGIYNGTTRINIFSNFNKNGNWHYHTITFDGANVKYYCDGVIKQTSALTGTLPAWKSFCMGLGKAGGVWRQIKQNISDLRIYCTALNADAIRQLYEVGAKIDNKQNLHTFELIETNKQEITKQGQTKGQNLLETYLPLYDKIIYTEPDGSTWIHIFHHNNPANSKFNSTTSDWTTGKYLDADRWYDVDHAIYYTLGPYEFMVKQKTTSSATETKYRWIQTANPLTAVWADVKPGTVTFNTSSGYTNSSYGGMYLFKNSNLHMCIANGSNGNWYGGIGAAAAYNGGIPGFPNTTVTSGYIDLYLRVYVNTKMIKNIGISSLEFIEL